MIDPTAVKNQTAQGLGADGAAENDDLASADAVQQALAGLSAHNAKPPKPLRPGELKYKLTMLLFPAILLIFVALYVASLASGIDPEVGLFRAGGASLVLAIIGRVAIGILGDETRLILNDRQIVAMARSGSVREYLAAATASGTDADDAGTQSPMAAQAAGSTGKE